MRFSDFLFSLLLDRAVDDLRRVPDLEVSCLYLATLLPGACCPVLLFRLAIFVIRGDLLRDWLWRPPTVAPIRFLCTVMFVI